MNRLLNTVMSMLRQSPAVVKVRPSRLIAAMEPLEGRQFFSASPGGQQSDPLTADSAVTVSATSVTTWTVSGDVVGEKKDVKFTITIVSDENGIVTGRIVGSGVRMKDDAMIGTHDSAGYHFWVNTSKCMLNLDGSVGSDGTMTGSFTLMSGSKVMSGTFVASMT